MHDRPERARTMQDFGLLLVIYCSYRNRPTAIVPGSHVFGIDRDGFPHSEERIDVSSDLQQRTYFLCQMIGWYGVYV
eukprot:SAG31_NODE_1152_length_9642_cov_4.124489_5_plen_77_part_00